jgi:hypothetical protein
MRLWGFVLEQRKARQDTRSRDRTALLSLHRDATRRRAAGVLHAGAGQRGGTARLRRPALRLAIFHGKIASRPSAGTGLRGLSSAGRATESHSVGHRFDPDRLHQNFAALRFGGAYRVFGLRASGATGSTKSSLRSASVEPVESLSGLPRFALLEAGQAPPAHFPAEPQDARVRGLSSAGRASDLHSEGHRFDPDRLHHRSVVGPSARSEAPVERPKRIDARAGLRGPARRHRNARAGRPAGMGR